jgi:hypothetical protein
MAAGRERLGHEREQVPEGNLSGAVQVVGEAGEQSSTATR